MTECYCALVGLLALSVAFVVFVFCWARWADRQLRADFD